MAVVPEELGAVRFIDQMQARISVARRDPCHTAPRSDTTDYSR